MAKENPVIGLDNVVIAELLSDDVNGVTYDTPIALKGAVNASVNPNSDVAVDYADNGPFFVMNNRGNTELTLELTNVDPAVQAKMLGQKRSGGITVETPMDSAPYFAMGFRVWVGGTDENGNKIYEYMWLAKGKFSVPESGAETKKESVSFQHKNMTAQFVATIFVPNGQDSGTICTHCRSDVDTSNAVIANWFNAPVVSVASQANTITVTSAAQASDKLTITFAATTATTIAEVTANANNITVLNGDGEVIDGTFAIGVSGNVAPTVVFTLADVSESVATVVIGAGVKDIYNVAVTPKVVTL
jgi:phi13 family phage major tail protein